MKQPGSGRERLVGDTVHDGTPQVTAPADAAAKDNVEIHPVQAGDVQRDVPGHHVRGGHHRRAGRSQSITFHHDHPQHVLLRSEDEPPVSYVRPEPRNLAVRGAASLAGSLNNLSKVLAGLGRREEALAASGEAVGIYRELAAARPDAFRPDLAGSLNNLAIWLAGLGRPEEALAAIQEAVTIRRELAARWPDRYQHELEQSLRVIAWLEHSEDLSDASPRKMPKE